MTTTKAYDDLVERLGREKEAQPIRADSPQGRAMRAALVNISALTPSAGPKRKGGWPKGKKRGPKAGK